MFDTMTLTKTVGALCGALLIFLMGNWAAETIYSMGGGHGDEHAQGYMIETAAEEGGESTADEGPSFGELLLAADADKGEKVFGKCKACHKLEKGENATGPYLYDVVGRNVDAAEGFGYSGALEAVAEVWTPKNLYDFLENPKGYAPGTTMGFAGLKKPEDRVNLIAYLDEVDGEKYVDPNAGAEEAAAEPAAEEAAAEPAAEEAAAAPAAEEAAAAPAAEEAAAEPAASGASDFAAMVAAADLEAGKKIFRKCGACHKVEDGKNGAGPHLYGVVGRDVAGVDGFKYSDALSGIEGEWSADKLGAFITNPRDFAAGNRMSFSGLKDEQDRANLIGYLQSVAN
ncbi:Cytochrome c-552 [Roseovarius gaetbuli]|uniref:Cytochrome c-552 n=1 Tax=Roseovarius gaetbuli TaxID=1356575 RepID=A0A1X6ZYH0_9RHOB|nr:cytochrome c family protein [Roseovarius gaetbuli]SLN64653.1 Cytochrome c-552 [Roseovarius gaetbuli]